MFARHNCEFLRSERTKGRTINFIGQPNDSTMGLAASGSNPGLQSGQRDRCES